MSDEMGKYCKAYLLKDLRAFSGWSEPDKQKFENREELSDDSIVYLQENYLVTYDIFKNKEIIFDNVTPEWIEYCQQSLKFEIPEYAE